MPFIVPTFQNTSSRYLTELELNNEVFKFRFDWNARETAWYMDILNTDENNILTGIKLVPRYALLEQYKYIVALPQGEFVILDLEQKLEDRITYDGLGRRWQMIFVTNEEIETRAGF